MIEIDDPAYVLWDIFPRISDVFIAPAFSLIEYVFVVVLKNRIRKINVCGYLL